MCHYQSERNNTHLNLAIQGQIFQQGLYTSTKTPRRISQGREHRPSDDTQAIINREARRWNRCRAVASWRFWALFALTRCVTWGNCVSKCGVETRPPHADGTQQLPRNFLDQDSQGGFYCTGGGGGVGEQLQCQQLRHALDPSGEGEEGKNTHNTATVNRCSLPLSTCWQHVDLPAIKVAHNKGPWVQNRTISCATPFQSISIKLQKPKQNIQIIKHIVMLYWWLLLYVCQKAEWRNQHAGYESHYRDTMLRRWSWITTMTLESNDLGFFGAAHSFPSLESWEEAGGWKMDWISELWAKNKIK